jgi:hypothetical protein
MCCLEPCESAFAYSRLRLQSPSLTVAPLIVAFAYSRFAYSRFAYSRKFAYVGEFAYKIDLFYDLFQEYQTIRIQYSRTNNAKCLPRNETPNY